MSSIYSYALDTTFGFFRMDGVVPRVGVEIQREVTYGRDGVRFYDVGLHGAPGEVITMVDLDVASTYADTIGVLMNLYKAAQGSIVRVTDDAGIAYDAVLISVEEVRNQRLLGGVGGLSSDKDALLVARWTLEEVW